METHVIKRATTLPIHIQPLPIMGMTIELGPQKCLIKVSGFKRRTLLFFLGFVFLFIFIARLPIIASYKHKKIKNPNRT